MNSTVKAYDDYPQVYDDMVVDFWQKFPQDFIKFFADNLPTKNVLDLGSGSGRDAVLLRDAGLNVLCVDGAKAMVDMAEKLGFESVHATFSEMSFDKKFGGVWAYMSLIHISKDEMISTIKNLRKFILPEGLFMIGVIKGSAEYERRQDDMPNAVRYFRDYDSDELTKIIEPLGFELLSQTEFRPSRHTYLQQIYRIKN
jgi:Methyltransferase domain.